MSKQTHQEIVYVADKDLAVRYQTSRATVWRWLKTRCFPAPIRLSPGCSRWRLADVEVWETKIRSLDEATK